MARPSAQRTDWLPGAVSIAPVTIAVLLALLCSVVWAFANVWVQRASIALGGLRALFWSQMVGTIALVPLALVLDGSRTSPPLLDLGITAVASALGYYGMVVAFSEGALSGVVPLVTSWAVPAAVCGVIWSHEVPTIAQTVGGAMILVGAVGNGALARAPGEGAPASPRVLVWAAASSVGFGIMVTGTARMRDPLGAVGVIPAVWLAQWLLMAPLLLRRDVRALPPRSVWPAVLAMALLESVGFVLYTLATRLAPVAVVSPPASLSSLLTVVYASVVLKERLTPTRWLLVLLAAAGMLVIARG